MTADEADAAFAGPGTESVQETAAHDELSLRRGGFFAVWVSGIMLAEQTLLNGGVLTVDATSHERALAGIVFNVLLIARAPLQLFQAVQTSLLPHLTGLEATAGHDEFARAVRTTIKAIAAFAGAVALGLLILGPWALGHVLFGQQYSYGRWGLALIGIGMGFHLCSGALNQAALARNHARAAAVCWLLAACVFIVWMFSPVVGEEVLRAEIGYAGATAALVGFLFVLYRRGSDELAPGRPPRAGRGRTRLAEVLQRAVELAEGLGRVGRVEDRRARHEQARAGAGAGRGRLRIDAAVDLDRDARPDELPQPRELLQRVLDERLSAPARVDGHAEGDVQRSLELGQHARRGGRVDRHAHPRAQLAHEVDRVGQMRRRLGVDRQRVGAGGDEIAHVALRALDHEVGLEHRARLADGARRAPPRPAARP